MDLKIQISCVFNKSQENFQLTVNAGADERETWETEKCGCDLCLCLCTFILLSVCISIVASYYRRFSRFPDFTFDRLV